MSTPRRTVGVPLLLGLVALVNRSRIFVSASRIGELGGAGIRLRTSAVDLRPFRLRKSEMLASSLFDRRVGPEVAADFALTPTASPRGAWQIASVALTQPGALRRRRSVRTVSWYEAAALFERVAGAEGGRWPLAGPGAGASDDTVIGRARQALTTPGRPDVSHAPEDRPTPPGWVALLPSNSIHNP